MKTPICDFIKEYAEKNTLRLHMPGHKGIGENGERFDITEINGADSLYEANGIIKESEDNASSVFCAHTFYSTEGSSLSIRAMLYLCSLYAKEQGKRFSVMAGRNAHKSFLSSAALIGFDVKWLYPKENEPYLSVTPNLEYLEKAFKEDAPTVLYITSPDYLGFCAPIKELSKLCRRYGVLLAVDNAHGAYLKFLPESRHPIDLGADICCDSAHKTLPVLTGGGYLHISNNAPELFVREAKNALSLFGSTSPSFLILASLDRCNAYLDCGYKQKLADFLMKVDALKKSLKLHGFAIYGNEPMKITLMTKPYGYTGTEFAGILERKNVYTEFSDPDFVTLMLTPELGKEGLDILYEALVSIPEKAPILVFPPKPDRSERKMSVREAVFSPKVQISVKETLGRVLSEPSVGCPPAVPIVVSGEVVTESAIKCFEYYGIDKIKVVK